MLRRASHSSAFFPPERSVVTAQTAEVNETVCGSTFSCSQVLRTKSRALRLLDAFAGDQNREGSGAIAMLQRLQSRNSFSPMGETKSPVSAIRKKFRRNRQTIAGDHRNAIAKFVANQRVRAKFRRMVGTSHAEKQDPLRGFHREVAIGDRLKYFRRPGSTLPVGSGALFRRRTCILLELSRDSLYADIFYIARKSLREFREKINLAHAGLFRDPRSARLSFSPCALVYGSSTPIKSAALHRAPPQTVSQTEYFRRCRSYRARTP